MKKDELAFDYFKSGCNCCQAVLCAFEPLTILDKKTLMMLGSSFGGGMGRLREVCGAVSAMFMILGLIEGYDEIDDEKKMLHYKKVQILAEEFKKRFGSIVCKDLLKNINSVDDSYIPEKRTDEYYKVRPCVKFVSEAAKILDDFLANK